MKKILLCNLYDKNDIRDITNILDYYIETGSDIKAVYNYSIINGNKVKNRHQVTHKNSFIKIV